MNDDWTKDIRKLMDGYEVKAPEGLLEEIKSLSPALSKGEGDAAGRQSQSTKAKVVPLRRYRWVAAAAAVAIIAVPLFWKLMPKGQDQLAEITKPGASSRSLTPGNPASGPGSASSGSVSASSGSGSVSTSSPSGSASAFSGSVSSNGGGLIAQLSERAGGSALRAGGAAVGAGGAAVGAGGSSVGVEGSVSRNIVSATPLGSAAPLGATTGTDKKGGTSAPAYKKKQAAKTNNHGASSHGASSYQSLDSYDLAYEPSARSGSWTMGAYYGGATGSGNGSVGGGMPLIASDAAPYGIYPADMAVAKLENSAETKRKAHHKQPIKAGVSVGYRLNNRWSVQTGVTYSYLSSDFTSDNDPKETQKLHYVGIPLSASYNVVKGRKAEVYVTAGGEVEKLVKGKTSTEYTEDRDVKEHRPQWSVKAAVGGAYHFTPTLSVYVEPGVSHHFDNHSGVDNVYKDRPTSFSLNMGFRVNLNEK